MFFSPKSGGVDWLLVCLGNPGDQYENTRHNAGFMVADELADRLNVPVQRLKFRALTNTVTLGGRKVLLMKPMTYMNLSGEAVHEAASFYKIPPERVLVVSDEVALPPGKIRVRKKRQCRRPQRPEKHHCPPWHRPLSPGSGGGGPEAPPRL